MKYKNPYYKKLKSSYIMIVSCGFCKTDLVEYQKYGKGGLINMYIDRIVSSEIDLTKGDRALICINCNRQIGSRLVLKGENKEAFRMHRSKFNTRRARP